jgi:hypothetical protein
MKINEGTAAKLSTLDSPYTDSIVKLTTYKKARVEKQ